ncbi:MAG: helix-turn-helix transcriptional regulator [Thermotogae bacterium]|nr:helix-turn-helix transcriptional regulator [Thermotogota bacterium]
MEIGEKLRRLRLSRGLTQEELATRADVTRSFISQLETNKTSPSIETLEKILRALGSDLKHFFADYQEEKVVFKKEERIPIYDEPEGVHSEILISDVETKKIDPLFVVLDPEAQTDEEGYHEGAEFGFVIEGRVELWLDGVKHKLEKGDCFYYRADKKHMLRNPDKKRRAVILWIGID